MLAAFNDFERLEIGEFEDNKTALAFINRLFKGNRINISQNSINKILELIGPPIPYFIQVIISQVINKFSGKKERVRSNDIEIIYKEYVLGVVCKSYFQTHYDRLKYYSKINERASKEILKGLAKVGEIKRTELYQLFLKEINRQNAVDDFNGL